MDLFIISNLMTVNIANSIDNGKEKIALIRYQKRDNAEYQSAIKQNLNKSFLRVVFDCPIESRYISLCKSKKRYD